MTNSEPGLRAAELRNAFDEAFARPVDLGATSLVDLLLVRVSGHRYALRPAELSGVFKNRRVVHVPSTRPELVGVAGVRGAIVPVYVLSALLGHDSKVEATGWLVVCGGPEPVALSLDEVEGYRSFAGDCLVRVEATSGTRRHVSLAARVGDAACPILDIHSILAMLEVNAGRAGTT
jgi:purine-binding chemotaxis protein CheW